MPPFDASTDDALNATTPFSEPAAYLPTGVGTLLLLTLPVAAWQLLRARRARLRKLSANKRRTLSTV